MKKTTGKSIVAPATREWQFQALAFLAMLLLTFAVTGCSAEAQKARLLDRAKGFFDSGEYDKSVIEYMNVLRKDPQNAFAFQQLGVIWYERGAPLLAYQFLAKAVELAPDNLEARIKLALTYLNLGAPLEARAEAIKIFAQAPTNPEAIILMADTAFTKESISQTEEKLRESGQPDQAALHVAAAGLAARRGDLAALEKEARLAVALDPKSVHAHLTLANSFLANKDLVKAGESFKAAAELAPPRSPARLKFAEFKLASGSVPEAKALLQDLAEKAPDFLPARRLQAQIAVGEKKYDEALALLDNVFKVDPSNIESRLLQAQALMGKGEVKKAVVVLESLHGTYPMLPVVAFQLAKAYVQDANPAQARVVLDRVVAANPGYQDAVLLLARLQVGSGEAQGAATLMEGLLKQRPKLVAAQLLLAEAYRNLGKFDDAAAVFREQIKESPNNATAYFMLGMTLRQKGVLPEARAAFVRAQELQPEDLVVTYQLVDLDILDKDFAAAHQRVGVHLQRLPGLAAAHFLDGRVFAAQRDWDRAEAAFLKALELDPSSTGAYNELIGVYFAAGKLPEASAKLESFLAKNPDDERALTSAAVIHEKMSNFPKARDTYEKLLALKPETPVALNNLAYIYAMRMGQVDKGYELARKARTLHPADPAIADTLGWILHKRGDYEQALALLAESAAQLKEVPEVQYHLGMAAYMMGQTEVARTALKLAAAATEDFPGKADIQVRLALLEDAAGSGAKMSATDLEAALQKQPDDLLLQTRLAEAYEREGLPEKAAAAYEKALQLNPKLVAALIKLAQLQAGPLNQPSKAMDYARKARELAPNDPRAVAVLGSLTYHAGDYVTAYGLLQEGARGLPDDPVVLRDLAWAAYSQGKVEDARKAMQQLSKAAPASPLIEEATSFLDLTALSQSAGNLAASDSKIESLLQKNPDHVPALMARAALLVERGDSKPAAEVYARVLGKFPDFAPAQKWLASLYAADTATIQKGYDLALKARKILSEDPELARILGGLAYQRNEFPFAAQLFQESARNQPLDAKSLYYLGKSLLAADDKSQGKEALEKALAASLEEPLATDAKQALEELQKPKE